MQKIGDILNKPSRYRAKNLSTEFQVYGAYISEILDDPKHCSLYIKLAKLYDRKILEEALNFTKGYSAAKSKARVFMWRLKQLKAAETDNLANNP